MPLCTASPLGPPKALARRIGIAVAIAALSLPAAAPAQPGLPARLSDAEFWRLVTASSEAGGSFPSDNFTSNEMGFPNVVARLRAAGDTGGVYLGVGPEQNFSYIAGLHPRMAFLVDIRRQSVIQHLMYKAIFELSNNRADFISLLFSVPRPPGLTDSTSIADIWDAYWKANADPALELANVSRIITQLREAHGFALDSADVTTLRTVYEAFARLGPKINYSGDGASSSGFTVTFSAPESRVSASTGSGLTSPVTLNAPPVRAATILASKYGGTNFAALTAAVDADGVAQSFLATEANFRYVKDLQVRNLFVPVVGDFAGPKAIRAIGDYLRAHDATITAFYTSNVEQYLFQQPADWQNFYRNAATLPITPTSVFIRSGSSSCPMGTFLAAVAAGRVSVYADAMHCLP